jgi:hypothetical protein
MRMVMSGCLLACLMSGLSGCQSWSQVGQGVPGGSRVAPPGTGTYQVPSSYYNNGSKTGAINTTSSPAASVAATTPTATTPSSMRTASQPLPTTGATGATAANWQTPTVDQMRSGINNTASAVFNDAGNRANQVVQASTSRAAAAVDRYTDPTGQAPSATRSLNDNEPAGEPQLDWQPPR